MPRGSDIYRDWSKLLDLDRPLEWMAACSADELADVLAQRHGVTPELLLERARDFPHGAHPRVTPPRPDDSSGFVEGAHACYGYAFTPYFPGWLIRSSVLIGPGHGVRSVAYSQNLRPSPLRFSGDITFNGRGMQVALRQTAGGDTRIYMALFGPAPPATVLAGILCGAAVVTPEPEPSAARVILIRLPGPSPTFDALSPAFLPEDSIAEGLAVAGLHFPDRDEVDRRIRGFLPARPRHGIEQVATAEYRELVEYFNREHFARVAALRTGHRKIRPEPRDEGGLAPEIAGTPVNAPAAPGHPRRPSPGAAASPTPAGSPRPTRGASASCRPGPAAAPPARS
jgi:hypothetical protein